MRPDEGVAVQPQPPVLSLSNIDAYYSLLTARRIDLLCGLRRNGPMSIHALSKHLQRDYKNVQGDIVALIEAGLVERDVNGEILTPWDRFEVSLPLQDTSIGAAA